MKNNKIFISHSTKDAKVVKSFVENILKLGMDISSERIFCSSIEGQGIQSGQYIPDRLKSEVKLSAIALLFISKNYKESEVCLNELGATWVTLDKNCVIPFLLPDVTFKDLGFLDLGRLGLKINNRKNIIKFIQDSKSTLNLDINLERIYTKIDSFLESLDDKKTVKKGEIISEHPTVFFDERIREAFPGVRGLNWYEGEEAIKRLSILLEKPVSFEKAVNHGSFTDPIWWFRGSNGSSIKKFERLSDGKCLLNTRELKIEKIAVHHSDSYYKHFVYVELKGDRPIGRYNYEENYIESVVEWRGYFNEIYALFNGIPIKHEEYEDNAALINGEIIKVDNAKPRTRFLTSYNFILCAKTSPFNTKKGEEIGDRLMNEILQKNRRIEEFAQLSELLPRNPIDN